MLTKALHSSILWVEGGGNEKRSIGPMVGLGWLGLRNEEGELRWMGG